MLAVSPVSVYEVVAEVPVSVNVPEELVLRYTRYPVAPDTEFQLTVILPVDTAAALTPAGVPGTLPLLAVLIPALRCDVPAL